jgi:hypothetical protein
LLHDGCGLLDRKCLRLSHLGCRGDPIGHSTGDRWHELQEGACLVERKTSGAGMPRDSCRTVGWRPLREDVPVRWLVASAAQQVLDLLSVERWPGRLEASSTHEPVGLRVASEHDPIVEEDATDPVPPYGCRNHRSPRSRLGDSFRERSRENPAISTKPISTPARLGLWALLVRSTDCDNVPVGVRANLRCLAGASLRRLPRGIRLRQEDRGEYDSDNCYAG